MSLLRKVTSSPRATIQSLPPTVNLKGPGTRPQGIQQKLKNAAKVNTSQSLSRVRVSAFLLLLALIGADASQTDEFAAVGGYLIPGDIVKTYYDARKFSKLPRMDTSYQWATQEKSRSADPAMVVWVGTAYDLPQMLVCIRFLDNGMEQVVPLSFVVSVTARNQDVRWNFDFVGESCQYRSKYYTVAGLHSNGYTFMYGSKDMRVLTFERVPEQYKRKATKVQYRGTDSSEVHPIGVDATQNEFYLVPGDFVKTRFDCRKKIRCGHISEQWATQEPSRKIDDAVVVWVGTAYDPNRMLVGVRFCSNNKEQTVPLNFIVSVTARNQKNLWNSDFVSKPFMYKKRKYTVLGLHENGYTFMYGSKGVGTLKFKNVPDEYQCKEIKEQKRSARAAPIEQYKGKDSPDIVFNPHQMIEDKFRDTVESKKLVHKTDRSTIGKVNNANNEFKLLFEQLSSKKRVDNTETRRQSDCPACKGTNWLSPTGTDGGVRHYDPEKRVMSRQLDHCQALRKPCQKCWELNKLKSEECRSDMDKRRPPSQRSEASKADLEDQLAGYIEALFMDPEKGPYTNTDLELALALQNELASCESDTAQLREVSKQIVAFLKRVYTPVTKI